MSDSDFTSRLGFEVDQASIDRAKAALTTVTKAVEKAADDVARSNNLDFVAKEYARMAVAGQGALTVTDDLVKELALLGASDAEIQKTVKAFDRQVDAIQKADVAASRKVAGDVARAEKSAAAELERIRRIEAAEAKKAANDIARAQKAIERAEVAARKENARIDAAKRQAQIDIAEIEAYRENASRDAGGGGSTSPLSKRVTNFGREIRNLPSVQTGLGFGTDAIGNFLRLGGAITGVSEKTAETSKVAQALTPVLGQAGAGFAAMALQAAPFVIVAAAAALAIKSLTDEAEKSALAINKAVDAQRSANEEIVGGLTSDQTRKKLEDLALARQLEQELLDKTTASYAQFEREAQNAASSGKDLASTLTDIIFGQGATVAGAKAVRADEDALFQQREKSVTNLATLDAQTADYNALLESGALAVNDAAAALERLSSATLAAADAAGRELQAEQKALGATEEQNKSRLESIEDEEEVIQRQIEVLEASGVVSEEVSAKLEALNGQLGALGKESSFIKDTALALSRQRDAEKKAQKDAEDAAKKVAKAIETYGTKQVDITRQNAEKIIDIQRAAADKRRDTDLKFERDLVNLTEKTNFDRAAAIRKSAEDEYQAILNANRRLEDLRDDAIESEESATNDRNFLLSATIREGLEKSNKEVLKDTERSAEDRARAFSLEEQERLIQLEQSRYERQKGYRQELIDNQTNVNRQLREQRIGKDRQLMEAQIAYDRELQSQQAFLGAMHLANASFYQQQVNMAQQALGAVSGASGGSSKPLSSGTLSGPGSFRPGKLGGLMPIPNAPSAKAATNVTIYANTSNDVYEALERARVI